MAYINDSRELLQGKSQAKSVEDFTSIEHLERALATRSVQQLRELSHVMAKSSASQQEKTNEIFALDVLRLTRLHTEFNVIRMARESYKDQAFTDSRIKPLLDLMLKICALKMLMKDSEGLYETGFFGKGSKSLLTESMKKLLAELRPHMVSLVEGYPMLDTMYSSIGNKQGDIYEA